jgi:hypothetical protein
LNNKSSKDYLCPSASAGIVSVFFLVTKFIFRRDGSEQGARPLVLLFPSGAHMQGFTDQIFGNPRAKKF